MKHKRTCFDRRSRSIVTHVLTLAAIAVLNTTTHASFATLETTKTKTPAAKNKKTGTVCFDEKRKTFSMLRENIDSTPSSSVVKAAWGSVENTIQSNGWATLRIETSKSLSPSDQLYAAGFLEGALTSDLIWAFHSNTSPDHASSRKSLIEYMRVQDAYMREEAKRRENRNDPFWRQVQRIGRQMDGLVDGYNAGIEEEEKRLTLYDMWIINMDGDVIELETAIEKIGVEGLIASDCGKKEEEEEEEERLRFEELRTETREGLGLQKRWRDSLLRTVSRSSRRRRRHRQQRVERESLQDKFTRLMRKQRCTAVVKLIREETKKKETSSGVRDVLIGHNSWEDYTEMLRIFKHTKFYLNEEENAPHAASFSSYPGMLSSTDDFYMLSSGIAIAETTVNLMSDDIHRKMCAKGGLASWVRNLVANRIARTAEEWTELYARQNAGTYNCQWMVVDYNKIESGRSFFWIVETIPGFEERRDMSDVILKRGYWPSTNRPYFDAVRERAGYPSDNDEENMRFATASALSSPPSAEEDETAFDMGVESSTSASTVLKVTVKLKPLECPRTCDMLAFEDNPRGAALRKLAGPDAEPWTSENAVDRMKHLLRYNGWPNDGISKDPSLAIASRYDLLDGYSKSPTGAVDGKIVDRQGMRTMTAHVIGGPTTQDQEPFDFSAFPDAPHAMLPERWDFDWFTTEGYRSD